MSTPSSKAKNNSDLKSVIAATKKLWRQHHLTYDQARYVAKVVRHDLDIKRPRTRQRVVDRLSRDEERTLISHAYRMKGERRLLIKTLFQTGTRVSEFVNVKVEDLFFDEQMILISKAKGGKSRYIPILPELAQELKTHIGERSTGYLFETIHSTLYSTLYSTRRIQQIVKETASGSKITKTCVPTFIAAFSRNDFIGTRDVVRTDSKISGAFKT